VSSIAAGNQIGGWGFGQGIRQLPPLCEAPDDLTAAVDSRSRNAGELHGPAEHEVGRHVLRAFPFGVRRKRDEDALGFVPRDTEPASQREVVVDRSAECGHRAPPTGHGWVRSCRRVTSTLA
jgi:hypothetical protein